ncbi:MAG TPA: STAS domain-containing protein [Terriglobales bacterium]|nr:STAS domain-containing protein [Terriglobales bacterium]
MLKITIQNSSSGVTLKLDGSLKGPWVDELRRTWQISTKTAAGKPISVDLAGATFADALGRNLLLRMRKDGVALSGGSSFLRQLLEDQKTKPEWLHKEGRTK